MNDKWELENYKILKNFMNGDPIVVKEKDFKSKWIKRQGNTIMNWENKSIDWDFIICKILQGCYEMYKQKPQLKWCNLLDGVWESNIGRYFIIKFNNGYMLKHQPNICNGSNFLIFHEDFIAVGEFAQQHFEEKN